MTQSRSQRSYCIHLKIHLHNMQHALHCTAQATQVPTHTVCLCITKSSYWWRSAQLVTVMLGPSMLRNDDSSPTMITSSSFSHICRSAAVFMGSTVSTLPGRSTDPVEAATWGQCFLKAARMLGIPAQHRQQPECLLVCLQTDAV